MIHYNDIKSKDWIGKELWVCDTNWNKRVIHPLKGVFKKHKSRDAWPTFHKYKRNGEPYAQGIGMFNHARQWESQALNIFETELECINYFIGKCNERIEYFSEQKKEVTHGR